MALDSEHLTLDLPLSRFLKRCQKVFLDARILSHKGHRGHGEESLVLMPKAWQLIARVREPLEYVIPP
jgi:hypothetical protein